MDFLRVVLAPRYASLPDGVRRLTSGQRMLLVVLCRKDGCSTAERLMVSWPAVCRRLARVERIERTVSSLCSMGLVDVKKAESAEALWVCVKEAGRDAIGWPSR
jgi:hypothetical protein